ncbi:MAG: 2'-5' RNA ligase [Coriobacteriia bacterium]|nr:2'-5' RNA ligase [Coriobacteriia bacterium]
MRKLVSIQIVKDIRPIASADSIELVTILGWGVVTKKNEFSIGQKCVFFEVDSFLPTEERFEFLRSSSYRKNDFMGEGFRLKTAKLRGEMSQGLAMPLSDFPELSENIEIDTDLAEILGVRKWEAPETESSFGTIAESFPTWVSKTDETRVQSAEGVIAELHGKPYYISTKLDGTSISMGRKDGEFWVAGRNALHKDDGKSSAWKYARKMNIEVSSETWEKDYTIQGEFCAGGIQGNKLRLTEPKWFIFNVIDPDTNKRLPLPEMLEFCENLGLATVPIEETGDSFDYTSISSLLDRAEGQYDSGTTKEGIVIRSIAPMYSETLRSDMSFKVINNKYLLKDKN